MDLTDPQRAAIAMVVERFGCKDDFRVESTFDLDEGVVLVTMGERKGRPRQFIVDQEGRRSK